MARARRRKLDAAKPWAIAAGVVVVAVILLWIVYGTAVLGVRQVSVIGTGFLTPAQVQSAAAVPMSEPLARVDLDRVRARVQKLAPVDRAVVSRGWPGTIKIEVIERTPVAAVPRGPGQWVLIDGQGVAYRTVTQQPGDLPLAQLATPAPGDLNTRSALTVLGALTADLRDQLVGITVKAPAQISLQLRNDRTVIWGDDTESPYKAQVATVLLKRKGDTIDVSAPNVVTIR
jgi:cell division protein FtsQ